jgi:hypothetical protein
MHRLVDLTRNGYYAWLKKPVSNQALVGVRQLKLIRASFSTSKGIYGSRRVFLNLREARATCSIYRISRLMRSNGIRASVGLQPKAHRRARSPLISFPIPYSSIFTISRNQNVGEMKPEYSEAITAITNEY